MAKGRKKTRKAKARRHSWCYCKTRDACKAKLKTYYKKSALGKRLAHERKLKRMAEKAEAEAAKVIKSAQKAGLVVPGYNGLGSISSIRRRIRRRVRR